MREDASHDRNSQYATRLHAVSLYHSDLSGSSCLHNLPRRLRIKAIAPYVLYASFNDSHFLPSPVLSAIYPTRFVKFF